MRISHFRRGSLLVFLLATGAVATFAQSAPLTPEQRALIFGYPRSVTVNKHVGLIRLQGTDYRGHDRERRDEVEGHRGRHHPRARRG